MSEPGNFLSRWSRRKLEARREAERPTAAPNAERPPGAAKEPPPPAPEPQETKEPEVDLTALPPLDTIESGTDIKAFLQKGVPADLTRAALRRAWTADPAIRDFIGVAENQWDFATGSDIPGFGPLEAGDDVRRMVSEIIERSTTSGSQPPVTSETGDERPIAQGGGKSEQSPQQAQTTLPNTGDDIVQRKIKESASQEDTESIDTNAPAAARRHGGALPE